MIQNNKIEINDIRKIMADHVQAMKDPHTASNQVPMLALMSFELIAEIFYGKQFRKEMMDIVGEKKQREKEAKASKIIRP